MSGKHLSENKESLAENRDLEQKELKTDQCQNRIYDSLASVFSWLLFLP